MSRVPVEAITNERLAKWIKHLGNEHATPLLLVGIGHDEKSGQVVICAVDEPETDPDFLKRILRFAIESLGG
jgi:hypothetical protein